MVNMACRAQLSNADPVKPRNTLNNQSFYAQYADEDEARRFHEKFIKAKLSPDSLKSYTSDDQARLYACTIRSLSEAKWDTLSVQLVPIPRLTLQ